MHAGLPDEADLSSATAGRQAYSHLRRNSRMPASIAAWPETSRQGTSRHPKRRSSPPRHRGLRIRRLAEAEAACAELLRSDPNQPDALQILGNIRARSGDTQAAEPLFERARAVSPRNIFILNSLGGVYAANGRIAEAREALEAALRIDGNFPWALQNYGGLLMEVGERAAAKRCFERALGTDPRHVDSIAALADLAEKENRLEDARALADRALALAPNFLAARAVIARLELRAGHADAAETTAREMLAQPGLRPNLRTTTQMLLGEALEKLGRFEEAFASFTEANEMDRKLQAPRLENAQYASSPAAIAKLTAFMRTADPSTWTRPPADGLPTPVFLVGFPRSGTTLLQQVLAGHPDITTLEEQDNFRDAHESLLLAPGALERWSSLPEAELGASGGASTGIAWSGRRLPARSARLTSTSCR